MTFYLAFIRGNYLPLGFEEFYASLEAEEIEINIVEKGSQFLIFESKQNPIIAAKRCAFLHSLLLLGFKGEINQNEMIIVSQWNNFELESNKTYSVRITKIGKKKIQMKTPDLESKLGGFIYHKYESKKLKVNLKQPNYCFIAILYDHSFLLGLEIWSIDFQTYKQRQPGKRSYFRPGSMKSDFARAMVNLSRIKKGEILLDPFCGSGGFIIESLQLGIYTIGFDIDKYAISGSKENFPLKEKGFFSLLVGDSRNIMIRTVNAIVTDPPYSIQSSTHGENLLDLIKEFLLESKNVISPQGYIVFCCPHNSNSEQIAIDLGFEIVTIIDARMHKSLTRRIIVLR